MSEQTNQPEVSQSAKTAALEEFMDWRGSGNSGAHVQRAMDAAVADKEAALGARHQLDIDDYARVNGQYRKDNTRLAKELAEAKADFDTVQKNETRALNQMLAMEKELAEEREKTARLVALINDQANSYASQLAAAQSALVDEQSNHRMADAHIRNIASALVEKEKELAAERDNHERLFQFVQNRTRTHREKLGLVTGQSLEEAIERLPKELSTERAAREEWHSKCIKTALQGEEWCSKLRAQLQQAEQALVETCRQLKDEVTARLQAEQERDEARKGTQVSGSVVRWADYEALRTSSDSLRAELAATQETARRVEKELERAKGLLDVYDRTDVLCTQGSLIGEHKKLIAERDALQKQNAELSGSLKALEELLRKDPNSTDDSPVMAALGNITEERDSLKARNAELLVKALVKLRSEASALLARGNPISSCWVVDTCNNALNQSTE